MKEILEPLKEYSRNQKQFDDSVDKTFEDLVKKSNIDVEKNRNTVKMYDEADVEYKKEKKKLHTLRDKLLSTAPAPITKFFVVLLPVVLEMAVIFTSPPLSTYIPGSTDTEQYFLPLIV